MHFKMQVFVPLDLPPQNSTLLLNNITERTPLPLLIFLNCRRQQFCEFCFNSTVRLALSPWFTSPPAKTTAPILSLRLSSLLSSSSCHPSPETPQWLPLDLDCHPESFLALSVSPSCSGPCPAFYPAPNPQPVLTKHCSHRAPSVASDTSCLPAQDFEHPLLSAHSVSPPTLRPVTHTYIASCLCSSFHSQSDRVCSRHRPYQSLTSFHVRMKAVTNMYLPSEHGSRNPGLCAWCPPTSHLKQDPTDDLS